MMRLLSLFVLAFVGLAAWSDHTVFAHVTDRAFVLLLPTHLYAWGGALAVALSFVVMALLPIAGLRSIERAQWQLGRAPGSPGVWLSLVFLAVMACLIVGGYIGDRDPLSNPLPTVIWTLWWVGFTLLHAVFGNLWTVINPWRRALLDRHPRRWTPTLDRRSGRLATPLQSDFFRRSSCSLRLPGSNSSTPRHRIPMFSPPRSWSMPR